MSMVHYKGVIGEFDYDDKMFYLDKEEDLSGYFDFSSSYIVQLRLCKGYKGPIDLPKGCVSCRRMFQYCDLSGCYLRDFDTSKIQTMTCMFYDAKIPEGFSLGPKFDTSNVVDMKGMFGACNLPEGFTLGDSFSTINVVNMRGMFEACNLPEGFTLGDSFSTINVSNMTKMFYRSGLPKGFTLGNEFDTSNVKRMDGMFESCGMPEVFTLGDKFSTAHVTDMDRMFYCAIMPDKFYLGDKFEIPHGVEALDIFEYAIVNGEVLSYVNSNDVIAHYSKDLLSDDDALWVKIIRSMSMPKIIRFSDTEELSMYFDDCARKLIGDDYTIDMFDGIIQIIWRLSLSAIKNCDTNDELIDLIRRHV